MPITRYFSSIDDMNLHAWRRCQEKGEYHYCRIALKEKEAKPERRKWWAIVVFLFSWFFVKTKEPDIFEYTEQKDMDAWLIIYDSFLKEFGIGEDYKEILSLKKQIAMVECDIAMGGARALQNKITILKLRLNDIMTRPSEGSMDTAIDALEQKRKMDIDEHTISVRKFYSLLNEYRKWVLSQRKAK